MKVLPLEIFYAYGMYIVPIVILLCVYCMNTRGGAVALLMEYQPSIASFLLCRYLREVAYYQTWHTVEWFPTHN